MLLFPHFCFHFVAKRRNLRIVLSRPKLWMPHPCSLIAWVGCTLLATSAAAQTTLPPTPIDPNWVYTTPLRWVHAVPAAGIDERTSYATILVLYPTGQYAEVAAALLEHGREKSVTLSNSDGLILRAGTWSRTDEQVIRIQARELFRSTRSPERIKCEPGGTNCTPLKHPLPGPVVTETCAIKGTSDTHIASAIHCRRLAVFPLRINLSLADLEALVAPQSRPDAAPAQQ